MITNSDLNRKVTGKKSGGEYTPIPDGNYDVIVHEIKDWKELVRDSNVNMLDDEGEFVRDANGKVKKELVKNLSFYTADVVLKIVKGEFKNRRLYPSLTTHPSAVFITENFLYAVDESEMTFGEIPTKCLNKVLSVRVVSETYYKTMTDPDTGFETKIPRTKAAVKDFIRPSHLIEVEEIEV
jgi:hypothetical protein